MFVLVRIEFWIYNKKPKYKSKTHDFWREVREKVDQGADIDFNCFDIGLRRINLLGILHWYGRMEKPAFGISERFR